MFDGKQFVIIGNPVILSSADYTIYADGLQRVNSVAENNKGMVISGAVYSALNNYLKRAKTASVASNTLSFADLPRGVYLVVATDLYHNYYYFNVGILMRYSETQNEYYTISNNNFAISVNGETLKSTSDRYFFKTNFYQVGY